MIRGIRFLAQHILTLLMFFILIYTDAKTQGRQDPSEDENDQQFLFFKRQLDSLRSIDNLEEWLYTVMDYLKQDPGKKIFSVTKANLSPWRSCRNDAERNAWFYFLANQGYYQLYVGNISRSIDAYEQAYRFYFEKPIPDADLIEYVLKPLGNNYTRLGDYDRAIFIQEKSLALAAEKKDTTQMAALYNNIAISARWQDQLQKALAYCQKGLQLVKKNTALHGLLLSTFSDILYKSNQLSDARINIDKSIKILKRPHSEERANSKYWLMSAYEVHGNIDEYDSNFSSALLFYKEAEKITDHYFKGERKREKAKLDVLTGNILLKLYDPMQAITRFDEALKLLLPSFRKEKSESLPADSALYGENTVLDAMQGRANALLAIGKKREALHTFLLSFQVDRKLRLQFFSRAAKQQQQRENRQMAETAMRTAYELWQVKKDKEYSTAMLMTAEMSKAQLLLDDMLASFGYSHLNTADSLLQKQIQLTRAIAYYERESALSSEKNTLSIDLAETKKDLQYQLSLIEKKIRQKYPMLESAMTDRDLYSEISLLQQIPAYSSVVEFFAGDQDIYIIQAEQRNIKQIRKVENAPEIYKLIEHYVFTYFQHGPSAMINDPGQYFSDSWQLYHHLWGTSIDINSSCVIIPDGITGYLPFDALISDSIYHQSIDQWPFMIKRANISFAYSLQALRQQKKMQKPGTQFAGFFIAYDSSVRTAIPAVKKEYDAIRHLVEGNFYIEQQATDSMFRSNLQQANIMHISTHAFLQGEEYLPVLQLADGKFYLFELYGQTLEPQLVVLSACRTGFGMVAEGEGIISLSRGFTAGGAGGIVAGLWNLHDESTAGLMADFYSHLAMDGHPALALHLAKLEWLTQKHDHDFLKLPYYWAGSIYIGDDQPVRIKLKKKFIPFYFFVIISIPFFLVIFFLKRMINTRTGKT